ncbi:bifunctional diaminohydroxyphosphoribosylaminopyrimidine deaminase/5-amino-6-(5-phosphoribosylamino)uracil reductase RibD [Mycobacterium sp.]|uniref:bifunctional diaminohydroxyphosphoribosylaminopyrimidine deaminase/5-amino-6-(5-phosphoribosylamino)uracil reductase RibD n=1 Tax=Mycobacterium sp. TaxID=1785 RepID=UPI003A83ADC0
MTGAEQVKNLDEAMRLAIEESYRVKGTTYPNPPVGAVIVNQEGRVVGAGATQPAGGDHAEVIALRRAGGAAAGGIAVVTMEPCNHYGKTPPCVNALIEARVAIVAYGVADPNGIAGGGAGRLNAAGVQVRSGVLADAVTTGPLREWLYKQRTGLPHVTWKYATSIDGRSAAADGSSQWISSDASRANLHRRRAIADAVMVGTGTVLIDNPALTARNADGSLAPQQPLRVVVGQREIPPDAKVLSADSRTTVIRSREPAEVLRALADHTDVLLEGGPTLAGAFLRAGAVNRILAYVAPILLGGPVTAVDDIGVLNMAQALRWQFDSVEKVGPDLLLSLVAR